MRTLEIPGGGLLGLTLENPAVGVKIIRYSQSFNYVVFLLKADGKIQAAKSKERYFKSKLNDAGRLERKACRLDNHVVSLRAELRETKSANWK